jgi:hypothetical protein
MKQPIPPEQTDAKKAARSAAAKKGAATRDRNRTERFFAEIIQGIELLRESGEVRPSIVQEKSSLLYDYCPLLMTHKEGWRVALVREDHQEEDTAAALSVPYKVWPSPWLDLMLQIAHSRPELKDRFQRDREKRQEEAAKAEGGTPNAN